MNTSSKDEYENEFQTFAAVVDCLELFNTITTQLEWLNLMAEDLVGIGKATEAFSIATKKVREFIGKLFGPAGEELGNLFGEQIKFWRFKNGIRIAEEAKRILEEKGINPQSVSPRILVPLLENASLEDGEILSAKWAKLLARAGAGYTVHPSYSKILSELNSDEVGILDLMASYYVTNLAERENWVKNGFRKEQFMTQFSLSKDQFERVCDNLFRLRLCQPVTGEASVGDGIENAPIVIFHYDIITVTPLGYDFTITCNGP